ncbi:DUF996 domain-containing protein [Ferroplasma sp.]|uniref:DUF996 domain-containing protein n=1 Tax=Ferroplasma sp. TaxID=2591003 RepID=UPI00307CF1F2
MYNKKIPELESARTFGIIGIILQFIGVGGDAFLHGLGFLISIVGFIFLLIAFKNISKYYNNPEPFRYMLYSLISSIVLGALSAALIALVLIPIFLASLTSGIGFIKLIELLLFIFLMAIVIILLPVIFEYIACNSVSELTGIDDFHTAALLLLIGIILTIIVVGIILILIGIIFLIIGFNKLPDEAIPVNEDPDIKGNDTGFI